MDYQKQPTEEFQKRLEHLINEYSLENGSDTPDYILAQYLCACLSNYNSTLRARETWYGREPIEFSLGDAANNTNEKGKK
jgi:hypothetical protein